MTMHVIIFSKQKKDQNRKRKLEKEEITTPTAPNPVQKENFRQRMYYVMGVKILAKKKLKLKENCDNLSKSNEQHTIVNEKLAEKNTTKDVKIEVKH